MILLILLLLASVTTNIILVWYTKKIINNFVEILKGVDDLQEKIEEYSQEVATVKSLEQFYGDDILHKLVKKTELLGKDIVKFKNMILSDEDENIPNDDITNKG